MLRDRLIGTWRIISAETKRPDGEVVYQYGKQPVGHIMYDSAGNMGVAVMCQGRTKFAIPDKLQGTAAELKSAFEGFEGYCGTYDTDEEEKTVHHRVKASVFPNWEGTTQTRYVEFSGNRLTLRTPPTLYGGATVISEIVWERIA
jgi:hypothetical protein